MTDEELHVVFAKQINRILINVVHMTQKDLAEQSSLSENTISRYVEKRCIPTFENTIRIADALDCRVDDLLNDIIFR